MNAPVYHGPGSKAWDEVHDPQFVADTDAIVRADTVTNCGLKVVGRN
jgi:alcohol dehydrogenase